MKPINGSWLPTKALGGGKVSTSPFSTSMSSKLLVSMSPFSSGTTGATAGRQEERERVMKRKRGTKEMQTRRVKAKRKLLFYIKSDWKQSCAWGFKIKIHQRHLSTNFFFSNLNKCMSILALVTLGVCRLAWAWHHSFSRTVLALCPIHSAFHKPCQERRFLLRSLFTRLTLKVCRQKCVKGPIR